MTALRPLSLSVNGEQMSCMAEPRETLADVLRNRLQLTATHMGCEMGVCGACLVLMDGRPVHSCLVFAVQAEGTRIDTLEGLDDSGLIADLQHAFHSRNALQCGFCTPGMLVTAHHLLKRHPRPSREAIREALSGNYCRCTGYEAIIDAIESVAHERAGAAP